ncbi:tyrosine-type recombinase/integrase [Teichococcus aestuarii]|uniref:tyrosine-type recombinase/integrase n=1 Tax=Teichococcus aestuarii TaxID=568898 RepID=UPI003606D463
MLYTGQRRSDVVRMGRQHLRGRTAIFVKQQKTGAELLIPLHAQLREVLEQTQGDHLTFLVTRLGAPFASTTAFYNWFVEAAQAAGLPPGLSPHGLRKAAARRLAEAGCSAHQIAAITGHKTLSEVERYTRAADQERLAIAAMKRISGDEA